MTAVVNNPTPLSDSATSTAVQSNAGMQSKTMVASNKSDGSRKSGGAANDNSQKRTPVPKAWSGGVNPITQRSNTPTAQNGSVVQGKTGGPADLPDKKSADDGPNPRLAMLMASALGCTANITLRNGDVYTGIFYSALISKPEPEFLLKMVQMTKSGSKTESNGLRETQLNEYVGAGEDHAMSFKTKDIADVSIEHITTSTGDRRHNDGSATSFRTDADISGRRGGQQRQLQAWVPPEDASVGQSLESSSNTGTWDQFEANKSLFGVQSDYDESYYTTRIDTSHPNYRQRAADAARIAQKMGETITEDGDHGDGWDEEDKFSGVRREVTEYPPLQPSQPNRYQPPARRAPTSKPTVAGAPVDPAIISSSMARPGNSPKPAKDPKTDRSGSGSGSSSLRPSSTLPSDNKPDQAENGSIQKTSNRNEPTEASSTKAPVTPAATNVEPHDALKAFKQFSEKQKIRVADDRRQRAAQDKSSKLNELTAFSKAFKLRSLVPSDLVPILAKDPKKQEAIVEKAQKEVDDTDKTTPRFVPRPLDQVTPKQTSESKRDSARPNHISTDRPDLSRHGAPPRGPQSTLPLHERQAQQLPTSAHPTSEHQGLSQRLAKTQRDRQTGVPSHVPSPLPISTQRTPSRPGTNAPRMTSQGSNSVRTPTSATSGKFNVKAHEFVPNPAANAFMPTAQPSTSSSPRAQIRGRAVTQASSLSELFGKKKPVPASERPLILDHFNPLKRLQEKAKNDGRVKDFAANGGIPFAHATPPSWSSVEEGESAKTYQEMFDGTTHSIAPSPRPMTASPVNPSFAHQHQLPAHLQHGPHGTPPMQTPQQGLYAVHQHPSYSGMSQPFDEQRAPSSQGHYGGPRAQNSYGAYPMPAGQQIHGPLPAGFPYPGMSAGHPQMMNSAVPPPAHFRGYPPSSQYMHMPGQPLAAPLMVQQGSQGSFLPPGTPMGPVPVYAAGAPPYGASQPSSGYPSPGRGAPSMVHQGSYQGQNSQMNGTAIQYGQPYYMTQPPPHNMAQMRGFPSPQPQYSQSPQQPYHYPPQPHRAPSHGYGGPPPQMSIQPPPHHGGSAEAADGMK